jgi:hypothetical protein
MSDIGRECSAPLLGIPTGATKWTSGRSKVRWFPDAPCRTMSLTRGYSFQTPSRAAAHRRTPAKLMAPLAAIHAAASSLRMRESLRYRSQREPKDLY